MDADLARYLLEGQRVRARKPRTKAWAATTALLVIAAAAILEFRVLPVSQNAHELVPFDAGVPNARQPALSGDGKWLAFAALSSGKFGTHPDIWLKQMPREHPETRDGRRRLQ